MRKVTVFNTGWQFHKGPEKNGRVPKHTDSGFEPVTLPHTWNNLDGQDGGMDYYRGACWYLNTLEIKPKKHERVYLEFLGANALCRVYANGKEICERRGGFSTFRCDVTDYIHFGKVKLAVLTDNGENQEIYPQNADFTFFGGLYRDVRVITVPETHFDLDYYGTPGVAVTPNVLDDGSADIVLNAYISGEKTGKTVRFTVDDQTAEVPAESPTATIKLQNPHLWNGRLDPYLYTVKAELLENGEAMDCVEQRFGVRTFRVDPDKGFFLNGKPYPLHGVSRHQDRLNMGWAITEKEHKEDMELIAEVGANTVRLAHYQHSQTFYDLCDEYGMVVWAEIPFISSFMDTKEAHDNTISQMRELVLQNYNHPSIVCWGIANEITIGGEHPHLVQNLHDLNDLCHELDKTRLTTMAQLSMVEPDSALNHITDIVSYNHYFGWYLGDVADNGPWIDDFHKQNPDVCLGISEYGCEGILKYHNDHPQIQDYSEEYQAYYHEKMLETFSTRPFLWSTHVWNMFDFASDMRDEGGVKGRNNKGLVTYDRKTKKDSFFIYKAYWTDTPFVHICSRRFKERAAETITVKIYSNCPRVTLTVNGSEFGSTDGDKVLLFENVPLKDGENTLTASAGDVSDTITLFRVEEPNPEYELKNSNVGTGAANWFEGGEAEQMELREGYLSVQDKLGDIMKTEAGGKLVEGAIDYIGREMNMTIGKGMLAMVKNFTLEKIISMAGSRLPQGALPMVNALLQQIPAPGNKHPDDVEQMPHDAAHFSIYDTIGDIRANEQGKAALMEFTAGFAEKLGFPLSEGMLALFDGFTVSQLLTAFSQKLPEGMENTAEETLQKIPKA